MSDSSKLPENGVKTAPSNTPTKFQSNPAIRMLGTQLLILCILAEILMLIGLHRLRARLPSRNWLIFLTITGSFSAAVFYDRREKKRAQQKWCNAVSHLSRELNSVNTLPRKLTVYLSAPPNDGLRPAREHFQEYVKPILVAAALDWDVVEGRKEGDICGSTAERIRKKRRKAEGALLPEEEEDIVEATRQQFNIRESDQPGGDLVLGRHTWKEYVRGLHEGWLGPSVPPPEPTPDPITAPESIPDTPAPDTSDDASPQATPDEPPQKEEEPSKPKKKPWPPEPYIHPTAYPSAPTPQSLPSSLPPSTALPLPHLLGFLNTPIRIARFLNKRQLADDTGRQIAAFILFSSSVPYDRNSDEGAWEQAKVLEDEEGDWHKSALAPSPAGEEGKERPWREEMVLDERIGGRMRKTEGRDMIGEGVEGDKVGSGNSREWKGGAERPERVTWGKWLRWAFDMEVEEPRCKGWEHGLEGAEWE